MYCIDKYRRFGFEFENQIYSFFIRSDRLVADNVMISDIDVCPPDMIIILYVGLNC